MSYNIITTEDFRKASKKLKKKYHSLNEDLASLMEQLLENPRMGILLFEDVYRIRLAIKSKGKGKSGGARVITFVYEIEETDEGKIYLLTLYDKSDFTGVSDSILQQIVESIRNDQAKSDTDDTPKK